MSSAAVQQTLFFPLLGRARATAKYPECFPDPWASKAQEFADGRNETTAMGSFPDVVYGLRHRMVVTEIRSYLRHHPGAAVVNMGCGLDLLQLELSDLDYTMYNLDFPEVLELRRAWMAEHATTDHGVELPFSIVDHDWMEHVDGSHGMIAFAAGVFFYLDPCDVAALVDAMATRFPGGRLVYDAESPNSTAMSERQIRKHGSTASMPFKVKDPYAARTWSSRVDRVDVIFNFSKYLSKRNRRLLAPSVRFIFAANALARAMYVVRVSFCS